MTKENPPKGKADGTDPATATEALLAETADVVRALLAQVRAGDFGKAETLAREQTQLRRALAAAIHERQTVEKLKRNEGTDVPHPALDLVAARDEIGRRLDRLRIAAGEDGLSGGSE